MGMYPEFGSGTRYEQALHSSPIARAFILEQQNSEVFLNAMGARSNDVRARHPEFYDLLVGPFVKMGQTYGLFPYRDEEDSEEEWADC